MVQKEKKYITWEGLNQHAKNVGKKIKECDTGVIGGYNGSFPLTAATKGNIYLLPATKKYYVCIKNYNGSQLTAPNANFEELSVYTNRSKLDNLRELEYITDTTDVDMLETNSLITATTWSSSIPQNLPEGCGIYGILLQFNISYRTPQIIITTTDMWVGIKSPKWQPWLRIK